MLHDPHARERRIRKDASPSVPQPVPFADDLVVVDVAWGRLQPIRLPGGVQTVGELEVLEAMRAGGSLLDTRGAPSYAEGTIPGARHLPHDAVPGHLALVAADRAPHVLFRNGPQCPATPKVIAELLELGVAPALLRYYRGGLHDWLTLGLPVAEPG